MRLERIAVAAMLVISATLVGLGIFLAFRYPQNSPGLQLSAVGVLYGVGAVGLWRRHGWGFVIAGVVGVAGTTLTVLGLLFVGASLAYYNWDPDINVLGPGLTTYPSLAILVAIVLAHATIVVVVFREAFGASRGLAR